MPFFCSPSIYVCFSLPPNPLPIIPHSLTFLALCLSPPLSPSLSLSLLYLLPLSFALRLAATADLNNSAQAGILQGPIVCAWQENEKERDREGEREKRERERIAGQSVSVCA